MTRKCIKCGYTRKSEDMAPEYECPRCGIIYDKFETQLKNSKSEPERSKQDWISKINIWRIIIPLPFITIGLYFLYLAWSKDDSMIIAIGIWPLLIGLWLAGVVDVETGRHDSFTNIGGDDGGGD